MKEGRGAQQGVLLEREAQMATLQDAYDRACLGSGQLVLVSGEAGIGKSAFVATFCDQVEADCRVLIGRCDPLTTPRPLAPLLDIARYLGSKVELLLRAGDKPQLVFSEALRQLTRERTVLVIEDIHWADEATLDLLRFLGRRILTAGMLILCTVRDEGSDVRHPLRAALGDLAGSTAIRRLSLGPLSAASFHAIAGDLAADVDDLHARTGGNPFFLTEILASPEESIPSTVSDAILARASRMSPEARTALDIAAVAGEPIDFNLLNTSFGVDQVPIAECLSSGFLVSDGYETTFKHQLTRAAVLESIPTPLRMALHKQVIAGLRARGVMPDELAVLADHAENAQDRPAVLEFAPAAAKWASGLGAHREAAAQYERALRFGEEMDAKTRADLTDARAHELHICGDNTQAAALYRALATEWQRLDYPANVGDSLRRLSASLWRIGSYLEALQVADQAVSNLEAIPVARELAWAYSNKAHLLAASDRWEESINWGQRALAIGKRLGDQELVIYALNDLGFARLCLGDTSGRQDLETSARLAEEFGYEDHFLRAQCNLAVHALERYQPLAANRYLDVAIPFSAGHELFDLETHLLTARALSRLQTGDWSDASIEAHLALARRMPLPATSAMGLITLGMSAARSGDARSAQEHMEEALQLVADQYPPLLWTLRVHRAEAAWLRGDMAGAAAEANASFDERVGDTIPFVTAECAYWLWRASEPINPNLPMDGPFALMVNGEWEAAAKDWEERGCPYEQAIALMECESPASVEQAAVILEHLGAKPALAMARQKLRGMGIKIGHKGARRATLANPWGLTPREADVLTLMAEGLTNPEIAKRLFVAPKTVEHHVTRVLTKLGAKNRMEAVQLAAAKGSRRSHAAGTTPTHAESPGALMPSDATNT